MMPTFYEGITIICTQKTAFEYINSSFERNKASNKALYWPIRGKNSSGNYLKKCSAYSLRKKCEIWGREVSIEWHFINVRNTIVVDLQ